MQAAQDLRKDLGWAMPAAAALPASRGAWAAQASAAAALLGAPSWRGGARPSRRAPQSRSCWGARGS